MSTGLLIGFMESSFLLFLYFLFDRITDLIKEKRQKGILVQDKEVPHE